MFRPRSVVASTAIAVLLTGLIGCGPSTTAPSPDMSGQPAAGTGSIIGSQGGLEVQSVNLVGEVGGTLSNGRWRVEFPADAVDGGATIAIGVRTLTSQDCELEIAPVSKNQFVVPVQLIADCRAVPEAELAGYVIFWFNPATRQWVPVPDSKVDTVNKTVSAPLTHFSRYAVGPADGKAGW